MMKLSWKIIHGALFVVIVTMICGCQTHRHRQQQGEHLSGPELTRNNCYSLLHQLLSEEKDVSFLRFIKREDSDTKKLIKKIAATAGQGADKLEVFAKADPTLRLDDYRLPDGEQKTRDAISESKEKELLHQSGAEFERTLLLTQVEALNYGAHLARIGAENDFEVERSDYLAALSRQLLGLRDEVISRLELKQEDQPQKQ